jgi:hypothetical protein
MPSSAHRSARVHQIDSAVAVEHDRFPGMRIDSRDKHRLLRPVLAGKPSRDDVAPARLARAVGSIHFERRGAHPAAHVGRILSRTDDSVRPLHVGRPREIRSASPVRSGVASLWLRHFGEDGSIQFGRPCPAGDLGSHRRSCRRPDDEIGLGYINPGIGQAGDETELPRISCRSAAGENQGSLV